MRRILLTGLAVGLGTAALAIPASGATSTVFSVDAVKHTVHVHINGAHRVITFRDRLFRPGDRSDIIGHNRGRCRLLSRTKAHCKVVFFFPNGKVKTDGRVYAGRNRERLPVIGGTRAFNGVGGKVIVANAKARVTHLTFFLIN
jgi:hypothetical protein